MRNIICLIYLFLLVTVNSYSQKEGQSFCKGNTSESYFPLSIEKKKIIWGNTYYFENRKEEITKDNKTYIVYEQAWENGQKVEMMLREVAGSIFQYEKDGSDETLRYNSSYGVGDSWRTADKKVTYTITSYNGKLTTPYCRYKNLMILEGKFKERTFLFYYLKGYGYVGATLEGDLISFATPEW